MPNSSIAPRALVVRSPLGSPCKIHPGIAPPRTATLLVTTFFPSAWHPHTDEIFAAIAQNLRNDLFDEVHTLHELGGERRGRDVQGALVDVAARNGQQISAAALAKLVVHTSTHQPTYLDLFRLASEELGRVRKRLVLLANADVVFDATVGLAIRSTAFDSPCFGGYAFPVRRVDAKDIAHASWFGEGRVRTCARHETDTWDRCAPPGKSFDGFLFRAPLPRHVVANFSILTTPEYPDGVVMNAMTAEHFAGTMFTLARLVMLNPCHFVRASHWHCSAHKMHATVRAPNGSVTEVGPAAPFGGTFVRMSWFPPCRSATACGMMVETKGVKGG